MKITWELRENFRALINVTLNRTIPPSRTFSLMPFKMNDQKINSNRSLFKAPRNWEPRHVCALDKNEEIFCLKKWAQRKMCIIIFSLFMNFLWVFSPCVTFSHLYTHNFNGLTRFFWLCVMMDPFILGVCRFLVFYALLLIWWLLFMTPWHNH